MPLEPESEATRVARDLKVLMADDDPAQLMLSEAALAGAGFLVYTVGDGMEAVEQFESIGPDLVVLDVNMPRLSGIDACRELRRRTGGRDLPILMLTGRNDLQAISDAFAAGASDFAQKGINPRLLIERVRFLLRDRALREELRASRAKLLLAQRIARVGHWELGTDGRTLHASPMIGEMLGVDSRTLQSYEDFVRLLPAASQFEARRAFLACATGEGPYRQDHSVRTADGRELGLHQEAELVRESDPPQDGVVLVTLQDLTRLHRAEAEVRQLSYTDTATGLPNRRRLAEQLAQALADRSAAAATAVVAFRIHDLAHVAQVHGSASSSSLIADVAGCIEAELARVSEGAAVPWRTAEAAVCRSADAQLALVLRSRVSESHLGEIARDMLAMLATDPPRADDGFAPGISVGLALADDAGSDPELLLQRAQAAAEQAALPWSIEHYSSASLEKSRRRHMIEAALRDAVRRGEVSLHYQPRVDVRGFETRGVECLVRWEHPEFGAIAPAEFLAVAESAGIVEEFGRWTLGEACRQLAGWRSRYERDLFVSVNLSTRQLHDPALVEFVRKVLELHEIPPAALELEITESSVVRSPTEARRVLGALRALGVRVAIDDFGAGYSSLGQLRRLPFDALKLDRSLMADLYTDLGAQGVTTAVIAMARSLNVRSVAEGVEDAATLEMLAALGCDEVQGHHVSPPLGPRDFEDWIEDGGALRLAPASALDVVNALEAVERRALASRRG